MLDDFIEEINCLKRKSDLLEAIWGILGPYPKDDDSKRIEIVRTLLKTEYKFRDGE